MKTIIVPTDFSPQSINAAHYAAQMLTGQHDFNLILYHIYEKPTHAAAANESLEKLKREMQDTGIVKVETLAIEGDDVITEIERVARHRQASYIVMGITGRSAISKVFMGSNTLKLVDRNVCPVLIIPPQAKFSGIRNVALTSDFKNVHLTTPSIPIKAMLDMFNPSFHIINVDNQHYVSLTEEYQRQRAEMEGMFGKYDPEFYFIGMNDFHDAISHFVTDKKIDLLITVPRHHSFLSNIFKSSHTKQLAYHSHIPILAAHE